jgi:UDP-glucuronate 4-epimerase
MRVLVTGTAGFIGNHVAKVLLERGDDVLGVDNLNDYYDVSLKTARLKRLESFKSFEDVRASVEDREAMEAVFERFQPEQVVHLAAQAGVRYSVENPHAYIQSNLVGFLHILEGCRRHNVKHLAYASSSSVYGGNTKLPFSESDAVDHPLSLYAATKRSNELMAHTYSSLYQIPTSGLRFFTVYGPWGRPDMALYLFAEKIAKGLPIDVFNHGNHKRSFTYIDDIVDGVIRILDRPPTAKAAGEASEATPADSRAPYSIFNLGSDHCVDLMQYIHAIETELGKKAQINFLPLQMGDVPSTEASIDRAEKLTQWRPKTQVREGVAAFIDWFQKYKQGVAS